MGKENYAHPDPHLHVHTHLRTATSSPDSELLLPGSPTAGPTSPQSHGGGEGAAAETSLPCHAATPVTTTDLESPRLRQTPASPFASMAGAAADKEGEEARALVTEGEEHAGAGPATHPRMQGEHVKGGALEGPAGCMTGTASRASVFLSICHNFIMCIRG